MSKPEVNQRSSGDQSCALPFIGMSYCNCGVRRRGQRVLLLLVLVLVLVEVPGLGEPGALSDVKPPSTTGAPGSDEVKMCH